MVFEAYVTEFFGDVFGNWPFFAYKWTSNQTQRTRETFSDPRLDHTGSPVPRTWTFPGAVTFGSLAIHHSDQWWAYEIKKSMEPEREFLHIKKSVEDFSSDSVLCTTLKNSVKLSLLMAKVTFAVFTYIDVFKKERKREHRNRMEGSYWKKTVCWKVRNTEPVMFWTV